MFGFSVRTMRCSSRVSFRRLLYLVLRVLSLIRLRFLCFRSRLYFLSRVCSFWRITASVLRIIVSGFGRSVIVVIWRFRLRRRCGTLVQVSSFGFLGSGFSRSSLVFLFFRLGRWFFFLRVLVWDMCWLVLVVIINFVGGQFNYRC